MAGFRDTLNLPKTAFPMKAGLTQREPERMQWWKEHDLYAKLRKQREGAPVWLLHDGPPYSNAHLHMGTAANKIWKDAGVRMASLMGLDAPYVPGWDNHGMPIEMQVSREMRKERQEIDRISLRHRCREYAKKWVGVQREEFERLGIWGEWDHPYLTMDHDFEAEIVATFAGLAEKGFVQRGMRSIHWCPTDKTALAEAELEYQDDPSPSIHVLFPLKHDPKGVLKAHEGVQAVAWTTTPWTLPANLGLMVDPAKPYAVVRAGGARFLVAEARVAAVSEAAGWTDVQIEARLPGAELVDVLFEAPFGNDSRVVDGSPFVSMDDGTGLVHTAPGHGKEDFAVGERSGLGIHCPVDEAGRFMEGTAPFEGRSVLDVNDDIIAWLKAAGRLLAATTLTHSYPHCWRCRQPVIFRATEQWFMIIDHDGHRDRALELIESKVQWDPAASQNRIRESVRGRPDWCLSRQRSWGVGIPALYCESCDAAMLDPGVMRKAVDVAREQGSDAWFELPVERFLPDGFTCTSCGTPGPFRKEVDILDVWFDSGSTHRAIRVTHPTLDQVWSRAERDGGRVLYFEGPDQHRGWFNSSLMVATGLTREAPYTDVLTHGWVLDGNGRAMHKSLGNVISPQAMIKKFGADVVRLWALSTDWRTDVRVGDEILQRVSEAYRKIRNTFRFLLGNLFDFTPGQRLAPEQMTAVDRAFAASLSARVQRIRADYENMLFHRALDQLLDVCTVDLSAIYLDVSKDRLYTSAPDDPVRRSAQTVLWQALHDLTIAASPALSFTAEEVWQAHPELVGEAESVHLADWPAATAAEPDTEPWRFLIEVRDAVNAAIEPLRASKELATTAEANVTLRVPQPVAQRLSAYRDELAAFLLVSEATVEETGATGEIEVSVTKTQNRKCERCWTYRADVGTDSGQPNVCGRCAAALTASGPTA